MSNLPPQSDLCMTDRLTRSDEIALFKIGSGLVIAACDLQIIIADNCNLGLHAISNFNLIHFVNCALGEQFETKLASCYIQSLH